MIIELGKDFGKELGNWVANYPLIKEPPYTVWNVQGNRMRVFDNSTRFIIEEKLNQWSKEERNFFTENFVEGYKSGFYDGYPNELKVLDPFVSETLHKRIHVIKKLLSIFEERQLHFYYSLNNIKIREKAYLNAVILRCRLEIFNEQQNKNKTKDLKPRYESFGFKGEYRFITKLYEWLMDEGYIDEKTELETFNQVFTQRYDSHIAFIEFKMWNYELAILLDGISAQFDHLYFNEIEKSKLLHIKNKPVSGLKSSKNQKKKGDPTGYDSFEQKVSSFYINLFT